MGGDRHLSTHTDHLRSPLAWDESLSRRKVLTAAAGMFSATVASRLWGLSVLRPAFAADGLPRPIPGGRSAPPAPEVFFHEYPVARGNDPSTITDFRGYFGVASIDVGPVARRDKRTGSTTTLLWRAEMRALKGFYVGTDRQEHLGTFGFV